MAFALGEGVVRIRADMAPFRTALVSARYQLASFVAGTRSLSQVAGFLAGNVLVSSVLVLKRLFVDANISASHLTETMNRVNVIFGRSSVTVIQFADAMARSLGIARVETLKAAASFGQMAIGAGLTKKEAAEFSTIMTRAVIDLQSFHDVPMDIALAKVASGLAGTTRPLRAWGALLSADRVKQEAYRLGIAKIGAALTEQQKVMARSVLMLKEFGVSEGDAVRTLESPMNQLKAAWGSLDNAISSFGEAMAPFWEATMRTFRTAMGNLADWIDANKGRIYEWASNAVAEIQRLWAIWSGPFADALSETFQLLGEIIGVFNGVSMGGVDAVGGIEGAFETALTVIHAFNNALQVVLSTLQQIRTTAKGVADAFQMDFNDMVDNLRALLPGGQVNLGKFAGAGAPANAGGGNEQVVLGRNLPLGAGGEDTARAEEKVLSTKKTGGLQSFAQFWEKLQQGAGKDVEQKQLDQLEGMHKEMVELNNNIKRRRAAPPAQAAGGW